MIDLTNTYKVEMKVNPGDMQGLNNEGLSRHVGTIKQFGVSFNETTGKYETGLDEYSPKILSLSKEEAEKEIEWIRATKANLEKLIGQPNILDPTNHDFWSVWSVNIEVGQDKKLKLFGQHPNFYPNLHWQHALALITIKANDSLPLSKKAASDPKYKDSQFYITTTEEEVTFSKEVVRKSRKRATYMNELFSEGAGNYEKALRIAYLLNVQKEPVGIEKLEEILEIFSGQPEYIDNFIKLYEMDAAELELRTVFKKAVNYDIIRYDTVNKVYHKGAFNMRSTENDSIQLLMVNQMDGVVGREIAEIKAAVAKKDSKNKRKQLV